MLGKVHSRVVGILGMMIVLATLPAAFSQVQRYTVLPQIAVGDGWGTELSLTNQTMQYLSAVTVDITGDNGAPMVVTTNLGTNSSFTFPLAAGATQTIQINSTGSIRAGYATVNLPNAVNVTGSFRYVQGGVVQTLMGVPQQGRHYNFNFPAKINTAAGINTGIALANPTFNSSSASAQTIVVNLIDSSGILARQALVYMASGAHLAAYLNQTPFFPGLDNFVGSISVSAGRNFNVLALMQENQAYGTMSVEYGPILQPFQVASGAVAELEPNGTTATAQLLTGNSLVNASFGAADDVDYYKVGAKGGTVLTVVADTAGLGSYADTVIRIEGADGTVYANDDQNGLYAYSDSFSQIVVPADGTYYIRLSEYYGDGGTKYPYKLHVSFTASGSSTQPSITSMNPNNGNQSTSTTLAITGTNLSGATAINFSPSTGTTITNIQSTSTQVTASLAIASDATIGTRTVSVTTPSGTSNSLPFTVNTAGGGGAYDGSWSGATSGGGQFAFTVTNNNIMGITVTQNILLGCCVLTKFSTSSASGHLITNGQFNYSVSSTSPGAIPYTMSGSFSSPTQASGSFNGNLIGSITNPCCAGPFNFTWTASKSSPSEPIQLETGLGTPRTFTYKEPNGNVVTLTTFVK
jgi:hypothetical protein